MAADLAPHIAHLRNTRAPKLHTLLEVQILLDNECWRHSRNSSASRDDLDYSPDDVMEIAEYMSATRSRVESSESWDYRIQQLRTLVAALGLLHQMDVKELHVQSYTELRQNILDRFHEIISGRRQSRAINAESTLYMTALFLVRLAAQYFSLFRRYGSKVEAFLAPVLGLALTGASIASGQYNSLQHVFKYLDQIIAEIPRLQSKTGVTLPGLQQITRYTVAAYRQDPNLDNARLDDAANLILTALDAHLEDGNVSSSEQWDVLKRISRTMPRLTQWYFRYGLLDCAIQLGAVIGPSHIIPGLRRTVQQMAYTTSDEHLQWKAIEFFLRFRETRQEQFSCLQREAPQSPSDATKAVKAMIEQVCDYLDGKDSVEVLEELPASDRSSTRSTQLSQNTLRSSVSSAADNAESTLQLDKESPIEFMVPCPELFTSKIKNIKGCQGAGISQNCEIMHFHDESRVYLHCLREPFGGDRKAHEIYGSQNATIQSVALAGQWLVISTNKELVVLLLSRNLSSASTVAKYPHGEWDPVGFAIHEGNTELLLAVGHSRCDRRRSAFEGEILIFRMNCAAPSLNPTVFRLPRCDFPKDVDISPDGKLILCRTQLQNTVFILRELSLPISKETLFDLTRGRYTPVSFLSCG